DPALADGIAGDVVAAAADGDLELVLAREAHRGLDVGGAVAANHQGRPAVDQPVVHLPGIVVAGVGGREHGAGELRAEGLEWKRGGRHRVTLLIDEGSGPAAGLPTRRGWGKQTCSR